jgi:hypothetical protein
MPHIDCPWCEADAPIAPELLAAAGGTFQCPACLTSVDLVAEEDAPPLALAA